jgi:hypothetical protein
MVDWRSDELTFKTDLTAYKFTDKITGEARIGIGKDEDAAFEYFVSRSANDSMPDMDVRSLETFRKLDEVKAKIRERRSDFEVVKSVEPAFR